MARPPLLCEEGNSLRDFNSFTRSQTAATVGQPEIHKGSAKNTQ